MAERIAPLKSEGELFKKIMGKKWLGLHPDIRKRFEKNPLPGKPLRTNGTIERICGNVRAFRRDARIPQRRPRTPARTRRGRLR